MAPQPKVLFIIIAPQPQPLLLKEKGLLEVSAVVIEGVGLSHNSYTVLSSKTTSHMKRVLTY